MLSTTAAFFAGETLPGSTSFDAASESFIKLGLPLPEFWALMLSAAATSWFFFAAKAGPPSELYFDFGSCRFGVAFSSVPFFFVR